MWLFNKKAAKNPKTYADMEKGGTRLLSGEWSLCAHRRFSYTSSTNVEDETGKYVLIRGDCRDCNERVVSIRSLTNEPA